MIEKDLFSSLKTVCDRVYPQIMPEDVVFPAIVYSVIFDGTEQSVAGEICGRTTRFQVDIYSKSYGEVKSLKDLAIVKIVALDGGSVSAQDLYEDSIKLYRQLLDFKIKE
ncbi:MAG: hypothetical protein QM497_04915 [Sulfurimonas sp.]